MSNSIDTVLCVFCVLFAVIAIVGNSLVCHIILHHKSLKTSMNFLIFNLAVVDSITGILGIYYLVIGDGSGLFGTSDVLEKVHNQSVIAAEVLCKIKTSFWFGSAITPALLVIIAMERYMAVVHPLTWRKREQARKKWSSLPCWLFGISFLVIKIFTITYSEGRCKSTTPSWYNSKVYAATVISLHFLLPFSFIFWAYYQIVKTLTRKNTLSMQATVQRARSRDKRIVIVTVAIITFIFLLCSGVPKTVYSFQILFPVKFYNVNGNVPILLFLINSASNPVIYFTFIKSFRKKLSLTISRFCRAKPPANETFDLSTVRSITLQNINDNLSAYVNIGCQSSMKTTPRLTAFSNGTAM